MEEKTFKIRDNSGDKKYFSIIPNYIVNHSTHWEKSLYLTLKRISGEEGSCWKSPNTLAKIEKCSPNQIRKTLKSLEKRGWIKKVGIRKTGITQQLTNEYILIDLWSLNNDFYNDKKVSSDEGFIKERVHPVHPKVSPGGSKEEPLKKTNKEYLAKQSFAEHKPSSLEGKEELPQTPKKKTPAWTYELIEWLEDKQGSKFANAGKQYGALGSLKKADYTPKQIKECYEAMMKDDYWRNRSPDFVNIANNITKHIKKKVSKFNY